MKERITYSELINAAIAVEDAAQTIYLGFRDKFQHRPDVAKFWQKMADEENQHAQILASIHGCVPVGQLTQLADKQLTERAYKVQRWKIPELLGLVKNLNDAYEFAYCIEYSEINTVFNHLAIRFLPLEESCDIISSAMSKHLLRLALFTREFGDAKHCKAVHAAPVTV